MTSLWENRSLAVSLDETGYPGPYRGSFGEDCGRFLNPLLLMLTYYFVFGVILRARFPGDPPREGFVLYFLPECCPWLAMSEAWGRSPASFWNITTSSRSWSFRYRFCRSCGRSRRCISEGVAAADLLALLLITRGAIPLSALWLPCC
jgi:lipopolysaccharide transport system permease protein